MVLASCIRNKEVMNQNTSLNLCFRSDWLNYCAVNDRGIHDRVEAIKRKCIFNKKYEAAWLLKAVTLIDLTTLGGDDTYSNVGRLCVKAAFPIQNKVISELGGEECKDALKGFTTAAVCVYPSRVHDAVAKLSSIGSKLPVASVATGFPSGQYPLSTRLAEIRFCVDQGAKEIDVVLDRSLVLGGRWEEIFAEVKAMKEACSSACLKTILATGECGSLTNVAKASLVSMMAGANFIKTSTGKETVNATLEVGLVMCRAIKFFYKRTGIKVGLKPAGGLKTSKDALHWLMLVHQELGPEWIQPKLFRIGASSLLGDIENRLCVLASGNF